jgi:hypothetical protein
MGAHMLVLWNVVEADHHTRLNHDAMSWQDISKGVCQALWPDSNSLLVLPHVQESKLPRISGSVRGLRGLVELLVKEGPEAAKAAIAPAMAPHHLAVAMRVAQQLPLVSITCTIKPGGSLLAGGDAEARISVRQENRYKRGAKAAMRVGGKGRDEGWWLVLGCEQNNELFALKRVRIAASAQTEHVLMFQAPDNAGKYELAAYLVSDCYFGLDAKCHVTVRVEA